MRLRLTSFTTVLLAALMSVPAPAKEPTAKPTPKARTKADAVTPADSPNPYSRKGFLSRAKSKDIQLVFLGDSITEFWQLKGKEVWEQNYAKYNAANFGVSSEKTEHTLGHLAGGVLDGPSKPKVVVVMIGTNNIGHHPADKPEWAAAGVKKIVETVHRKLPQTKVLLLGVFPRDRKDSPARKSVEAINAIISKFDDGKKTRYLDLGPKFLDDSGEIPTDIMPDGLHPEAKGYEIWAEAMRPLLDEMMAAGSR
jgi:lysophospholipase L1-like esterase